MEMGRHKKLPDGMPYFRLTIGEPVPRKFWDFAKRRIGELATYYEMSKRPVLDLLANAYHLGMTDAVDAMNTVNRENAERETFIDTWKEEFGK